MQFLLDADHGFEHHVKLEVVEGVMLYLKLGIVAFDVEEPRTPLAVNLEAELEQLAKLVHGHLGAASVSLPKSRFDQQED